MNYLQLDIFLATCGVAIILRYLLARTKHLPLPPGPKPLPIIGNLLNIPKHRPWETYGKWAKEYGDIVYLYTFGKSFIIVNTYKAASEIFEKQIYSGRPHLTMMHDLMGFGLSSSQVQYGSTWRKHRTMFYKQFNSTAAQEFWPQQMDAARRFLRSILESPQDYRLHLRHMTAGIVMSIAYGYNISPKADPFVSISERVGVAFGHGIRLGAYLVDFIPSLRHVPEWVPGAGFQKFAREARETVWASRNLPFEDVKRRLADGTARPSFVANALTGMTTDQSVQEEEEIIRNVAGSIYGAGTDTTVSSIHSFILAMILYPDVQKQAQIELDGVVGQGRLPQFSDRAYLPYIGAIIKETLRWNPVFPTGVPHSVIEDAIYNGYHIPKGTAVIGNAWDILHDPGMYPDPFVFRPERFLPDQDGRVARDPAISGAFGFGRRICAGRHLAEATVWIAAASLLAAFDITPAVDEHGCIIDVRYALSPPQTGTLIHPHPFPCSFKPRSSEVEMLIK